MIDPAISQPTTANPFAQPTLADNFAKAGGAQAGSALQVQQATRDAEVQKAKDEFATFRTKLGGSTEQKIKDQVLYIAAHVQRDASYPVTDVVIPSAWTDVAGSAYKGDQKLNWRDAASALTGKPRGTISDQSAASSILVYLSRDISVARENSFTPEMVARREALGELKRVVQANLEALPSKPLLGYVTRYDPPQIMVTLPKDLSIDGKLFKQGQQVDWCKLAENLGISKDDREKGTFEYDGWYTTTQEGNRTEEGQYRNVLACVDKEIKKLNVVDVRYKGSAVTELPKATLSQDDGERLREAKLSVGSAAQQLKGAAQSIRSGADISLWNKITLSRDLVVDGNLLYKKGDVVEIVNVASALGMNELEARLGTDKVTGNDIQKQEAANILRYLDQSPGIQDGLKVFDSQLKNDLAKDNARMVELALPYEQFKSAVQAIAQDGNNWQYRHQITFQADMVVGDTVVFKKGEIQGWNAIAQKLGLGSAWTGGDGPDYNKKVAQTLLKKLENSEQFFPKELTSLVHKWAGTDLTIYDQIGIGLGGGMSRNAAGSWEVKSGQAIEQQRAISSGYDISKNTLAKSKALAQIKSEMKLEGGDKDKTGKIKDVEIELKEGFVNWKGESFPAGKKMSISTLFWQLSGGSAWPEALPGEERASTLARYNGVLDSQSSVFSSEYSLNNQKLQTAVTNFQTWTSVMQGILSALSNMSKEIAQGMK